MFPLLRVFAPLVWVQYRGFKTLRTKSRRMESGHDGRVESEPYTPSFMKVSILIVSPGSCNLSHSV